MKVLFISSVFPSPLRPNNGAFNAVMIRGLAAEDEVKVVAPVPWPVVVSRIPRRRLSPRK